MNEARSQLETIALDERIASESPSYAAGVELLKDKSYAGAEVQLKAALSEVINQYDKDHVKYRIGTALDRQGKYLEEVEIYKEVAASESYGAMNRAYAVMQLGQVYMKTRDEQIWQQIVSTDPYSQFDLPNREEGIAALYRYSTSLYPLAIPELRVADWYASEVKRLALLPETPEITATIADYIERINSRIARADADILRIQNDPNTKAYVPEALLRKAAVIGTLALSGYEQNTAAVQAFTDTLNYYATTGNTRGEDAHVRLRYAMYLAEIDIAGNKTFIQELLQPVVTIKSIAPETISRPIILTLQNERTRDSEYKKTFILLGKSFVEFKQLLISLGWKEADFR